MTIFFSLLVVSIVKKKDIAAEFTYGTSMSMQNKLTDQWWELCETSNRIGKDNIANVVKHMNGYDHVKLLYAINAWNAAAPQLIDPTGPTHPRIVRRSASSPPVSSRKP